jgi:hypothetical protein
MMPPDGVYADQSISLFTGYHTSDEQRGPSLEALFHVTPRNFPNRIEVLYEGEPLPQPWSVIAGTTITDITFRYSLIY